MWNLFCLFVCPRWALGTRRIKYSKLVHTPGFFGSCRGHVGPMWDLGCAHFGPCCVLGGHVGAMRRLCWTWCSSSGWIILQKFSHVSSSHISTTILWPHASTTARWHSNPIRVLIILDVSCDPKHFVRSPPCFPTLEYRHCPPPLANHTGGRKLHKTTSPKKHLAKCNFHFLPPLHQEKCKLHFPKPPPNFPPEGGGEKIKQ